MEISVQLVKNLRKQTGYGMMDCKKALTIANGDVDAAIQWLKTKPYRIGCGRLSTSRVSDCMFCTKEVCDGEYDAESETCRFCFPKRCMEKEQ